MSIHPVLIRVALDPASPPFERHDEPVTTGVAFPRGEVIGNESWSLLNPHGEAVPVQTTILDRWGDNSVRWLLVDFQADVAPEENAVYRLQAGATLDAGPPTYQLLIDQTVDRITVHTGVAEFEISRSGAMFVSKASVDGNSMLAGATIDADDADGVHCRLEVSQSTLERSGELTAIVRVEGVLKSSAASLDATIRLQFHAGMGVVRTGVTIANPRAARHSGGIWDLGDSGSVLLRDLSISLRRLSNDPAEVWGSLARDESMSPAGTVFAVYQDSSGGDNWLHPNHVNRNSDVPSVLRGFRAVRDGAETVGMRATPVASVGRGDTRIAVAAPRWWEVFPKMLTADRDGCTIGVLPRQYSDLHELQGGEQTTFTFVFCCGRDTVSAQPLAWVRAPLQVAADSESYRRAELWAPLSAGSPAAHEGYDTLVTSIVEGDQSFQQRRELIDEFGWRNFGEIYADHEAVHQSEPMVSHYNNQYDAIAGFATRFLQTGDPRWWSAMDELAGHVIDIDLYRTDRDRAAYNGGYFWHTQHYAPAGTATHRAYSRGSGTAGGGPSAEHNYTTGLLLHYFLTGSERSRAAVIQLADWVMDMDDGSKSRFRWLDRRDTGLASGTRSPDFHGPGRGAGNSINALLDAHRLTNGARYLAKADALVARCVHPDENIDALDLLDAENRWSYTVFLQALGKYLEHRRDRGLLDSQYEYGRAVLLKYAGWMAVHERPYLDQPERLEHPTETWAAQEVRKSAVMEFAARYAEDDETRARFIAVADRFMNYAVTTLHASPTGRLARPLILMLTYGFQRPLSDAPIAVPLAQPVASEREVFVPLRSRLVRRAILAGAGLSAAALLLIVLLIS